MPCSPPRKPAAGSRSDMHSAFERSGNKWQHPWSVGDRLRSLAQTAAMRMLTKCAARTDPRALLLGAPQIARAAVRLPRRWVFGLGDVGARISPAVQRVVRPPTALAQDKASRQLERQRPQRAEASRSYPGDNPRFGIRRYRAPTSHASRRRSCRLFGLGAHAARLARQAHRRR